MKKEKGKAPYTAMEVANYIIEYEHSKGRSISNLKLQKLLYFVQARFFMVYEKPCFRDKIEAWSFGPVVVNVYHAYKYSGGMDITCLEEDVDINISNRDKEIINEVLESFAKIPIFRLVEITHHQTPWVYAKRNQFNNEITQEAIQDFFCND